MEAPVRFRLLGLDTMLWEVHRKLRRVNWAIKQTGESTVELNKFGMRNLKELAKSAKAVQIQAAKLVPGVVEIEGQVQTVEEQKAPLFPEESR